METIRAAWAAAQAGRPPVPAVPVLWAAAAAAAAAACPMAEQEAKAALVSSLTPAMGLAAAAAAAPRNQERAAREVRLAAAGAALDPAALVERPAPQVPERRASSSFAIPPDLRNASQGFEQRRTVRADA